MFCSEIEVHYFYNPQARNKYSKRGKLFSIFNYLAQFKFPDLSLSSPHFLPLGPFIGHCFKVKFQSLVMCLGTRLPVLNKCWTLRGLEAMHDVFF